MSMVTGCMVSASIEKLSGKLVVHWIVCSLKSDCLSVVSIALSNFWQMYTITFYDKNYQWFIKLVGVAQYRVKISTHTILD